MKQLELLSDRRFAGFFWTQFLGALNDNLFKNALAILIVFKSLSIGGLGPSELVVLSAGFFIFPFVTFSAFAGQLADRFEKPRLMRWVKLAEIVLMILAAVGLLLDDLVLLLVVLFLMGAQSSFFGPAKYSILPQLLRKDEMIGGNAIVETGTFLAILLGTIAGGVLIAIDGAGRILVGAAVFLVAAAGYACSLTIPDRAAQNPSLRISLNPIAPIRETIEATRSSPTVFWAVLGISWFWFYGGSFIALLPDYGKSTLQGSEHVVTSLLALFCVGTAIGSLLCERLSGEKIELGLVPIGSIGLSLVALDLWWVGAPAIEGIGQRSIVAFANDPTSWRIMIDFVLLSTFGGLFIVPLYAVIQQRSPAEYRSRVIAGANILNSMFMVASTLMLMALIRAGFSNTQIFAVIAALNALMAAYIYKRIPEFLFRFVAWCVANVLYRVRVDGLENVPDEGPALIVANHVSLVDWLLIASALERPPRFVMAHEYADIPIAGWLLRDAKVIPIAPEHESRDTLAEAFDRIAGELEAGALVCIFPEGKLTRDGRMNEFRSGVERILQRTPVPVIPIGIRGMWGSFFSRKDDAAMRRPFRRIWSSVSLAIGRPLPAQEASRGVLAGAVAKLAGLPTPRDESAAVAGGGAS